MHICHVVLSLEPGGLENGVVNILNGLDREEFRSSVVCLRRTGEFATRVRAGVPVVTMGLQSGNDPRTVLRLANLLRRSGVDIVHTRNVEPFFYGLPAARLAGVPAVIHSEHGRTFPERPLRAMAQRLLLHHVDAAFTVSARLRADLAKELRMKSDRFEVIYNGVDIARFGRLEALASNSDRPLRIGSVGRLVRVKNYPLLLHAFARLPHELPCTLLLIGEGPERGALTALARELGVGDRVQFAGHRDDVHELLRTVDIFVLPSISEGMSNTLLEAMAAGVPVLASDVGGNLEIIESERDGLLFRSGDEEHALAQLRRLVISAELRQALGREAAGKVRRDFSIDAMLRNYARLYRHVCESTRRKAAA